jgi:hypothetical protein
MITRIEAYRYRCFERLDLPVGRYQVLVGMNGSGKSTLIDIPVLLGEIIAHRSVNHAFFRSTSPERRARADSAIDVIHGRTGEWFALAVEAQLPDIEADRVRFSHVRYEMAFALNGGSLAISQEAVILFNGRDHIDDAPPGMWLGSHMERRDDIRAVLTRNAQGHGTVVREARLRGRAPDPDLMDRTGDEPALSFVSSDPQRYPACLWLRSLLSRGSMLYQPVLTRLRNAQRSPGADLRLVADASTLPWLILRLANEAPQQHEEWCQHVQGSLPLFEKADARQREDDQFAYLRAHYRNGLVVPGHGLSDGTLSVLALSILPFVPALPAFLAIEEPENGIHPKAIETILESLQVAENSQIWVTSHSPIVVAVTPREKLLFLRQSGTGGVEIIRGDRHPELANWRGLPELETLYRAGVL